MFDGTKPINSGLAKTEFALHISCTVLEDQDGCLVDLNGRAADMLLQEQRKATAKHGCSPQPSPTSEVAPVRTWPVAVKCKRLHMLKLPGTLPIRGIFEAAPPKPR